MAAARGTSARSTQHRARGASVSLPSRDAKNAETCEHSVSRPTASPRVPASRPCETSPGPAGDGAVGTATSIAPDIARALCAVPRDALRSGRTGITANFLR